MSFEQLFSIFSKILSWKSVLRMGFIAFGAILANSKAVHEGLNTLTFLLDSDGNISPLLLSILFSSFGVLVAILIENIVLIALKLFKTYINHKDKKAEIIANQAIIVAKKEDTLNKFNYLKYSFSEIDIETLMRCDLGIGFLRFSDNKLDTAGIIQPTDISGDNYSVLYIINKSIEAEVSEFLIPHKINLANKYLHQPNLKIALNRMRFEGPSSYAIPESEKLAFKVLDTFFYRSVKGGSISYGFRKGFHTAFERVTNVKYHTEIVVDVKNKELCSS